MTKTVTVQARMEPKLKKQADKVLASLGINATTAITLFYTQMVRQRGIPLELKVPNDETVAAIQELQDPDYRATAKKFKSVNELFDDLDS
jgi:DNA-damage-inducible protein J